MFRYGLSLAPFAKADAFGTLGRIYITFRFLALTTIFFTVCDIFWLSLAVCKGRLLRWRWRALFFCWVQCRSTLLPRQLCHQVFFLWYTIAVPLIRHGLIIFCHFGKMIDCRTVQCAHSWLLLWRGPSVHFWALAAQPCNFPLAIGQLTCKLFQLCKKSFQGSVLC